MKASLCHICGKPASNTCSMCGQPACSEHFDAVNGVCTIHKQGRRVADRK